MGTDSPNDNPVLDWYQQYIGSPDQETDVYVGFALFFSGIALAGVGLVTFLWSAAIGDTPFAYNVLRKIAGAAGATGLTALLLGVTVLLPVDRRVMYGALVGSLVSLVGVGLFVNAYPVYWNVPGSRDASGQIVAVYALGIAVVVISTATALVGYRVEQARGPEKTVIKETVKSESIDTSEDPEAVGEQVKRDMKAALGSTEISWGGVKRMTTKRLSLNTQAVDEVDHSTFDQVDAKEIRASGANVDEAVSGLKNLKGNRAKTSRSDQRTDNQVAALQQLKEEKQREAELKAEEAGLTDRLRELIS